MQKKTLIIEGKKWKYWEHCGFVEFQSLSRMFWDKAKGSPNLDVIAKFDKMGYDLISESFLNMIFKKRKTK